MASISLKEFVDSSYLGYTGSQGPGYTGSQGVQGDIGYTGSQGTSFTWLKKNSSYLASNLDAIIADTSNGAFTITLPASPSVGEHVHIIDGNDWSVNAVMLGRNGSTIEGLNEDLILNIKNIRVDVVYDGDTWQVYTNIGRQGTTGYTGSAASIGGASGQIIYNDNDNGEGCPDLFYNTITSRIGVGTITPTEKLEVNGNVAAIDFISTSDASLKENITKIDGALERLMHLNGYTFKYRETHEMSSGLLAHEVEEVLPEVVRGSDGTKKVAYGNMVGLLVEAIKDLKKEIDFLKNNK